METLTADELMAKLFKPTEHEIDADKAYEYEQGQIEARAQGCMLGTWKEGQ